MKGGGGGRGGEDGEGGITRIMCYKNGKYSGRGVEKKECEGGRRGPACF